MVYSEHDSSNLSYESQDTRTLGCKMQRSACHRSDFHQQHFDLVLSPAPVQGSFVRMYLAAC